MTKNTVERDNPTRANEAGTDKSGFYREAISRAAITTLGVAIVADFSALNDEVTTQL